MFVFEGKASHISSNRHSARHCNRSYTIGKLGFGGQRRKVVSRQDDAETRQQIYGFKTFKIQILMNEMPYNSKIPV